MEGITAKVAFTAVTTILAAYFILPWALKYPVLLGKTRVWEPDPQFTNLHETCIALHPSKLHGCEKFKIIGDILFAACVSDWESRKKWFPPMGDLDISLGDKGIIRDSLYTVDLRVSLSMMAKGVCGPELLRINADGDSFYIFGFVLKGMDVVEVAPGDFSIYMVNHRRDASVVESFSYKSGSGEASYLATYNGVQQGLINPNDIFAVSVPSPGSSPQNEFFVTNDHYFRSSRLGRMLEKYLRLPTGSVYYHSKSTGFRKVLRGFSNANGIAGFNNRQLDSANVLSNMVFVASILEGTVTAYRYVSGRVVEKGGLVKLREFAFDFVMDNLAISQDGRWLYITGHGEPAKLDSHWRSPAEVPSASVSYRMSLTELGAYFGNKGEMGESRVEKIVVDRMGLIGNASTTAVGDDILNKFWISGLTFRGIMECSLYTSALHEEEEAD
ncbi:Serum paraoxonase/arylesterase 2 [Orbilia oligospora]|uniref:Serum paraoxonase/arylesterase 2 n=1 Tax=Orbilia oligospora TaxID=2813651 RepID=A0A7C8JI87_ORBOL|nr:Serum paraoxonase/arylesterase 2 [Orbilia oligospora]KAF3119957.1 Serum paraoxonase/arylesterase 2 [Orbilia oligospora]